MVVGGRHWSTSDASDLLADPNLSARRLDGREPSQERLGLTRQCPFPASSVPLPRLQSALDIHQLFLRQELAADLRQPVPGLMRSERVLSGRNSVLTGPKGRADTRRHPDKGRRDGVDGSSDHILAKLPKQQALHDRIRAAYWAALDEAASAQQAEASLRSLVGELARDYPSAAACLADDLPALTVHLRYPLRLRKRWRSSNLLERSLGEVKRRTRSSAAFRARRAA